MKLSENDLQLLQLARQKQREADVTMQFTMEHLSKMYHIENGSTIHPVTGVIKRPAHAKE